MSARIMLNNWRSQRNVDSVNTNFTHEMSKRFLLLWHSKQLLHRLRVLRIFVEFTICKHSDVEDWLWLELYKYLLDSLPYLEIWDQVRDVTNNRSNNDSVNLTYIQARNRLPPQNIIWVPFFRLDINGISVHAEH